MHSRSQDSYGRYLDEGFQGTALTGINEFGDQAPVWRAIDARYDQCVGNCDCIPERDQPDVSFSVHFSCIQGVNKPGGYATEKEFGEAMSSAPSCTRYWFWHVWCVRLPPGVRGGYTVSLCTPVTVFSRPPSVMRKPSLLHRILTSSPPPPLTPRRYEKFKRAHGRLPEPYTGPEIPGYNRATDAKLRARLLAAGNVR